MDDRSRANRHSRRPRKTGKRRTGPPCGPYYEVAGYLATILHVIQDDPPERGALDDDFDGAREPSVASSEGVVDLDGSLGLVQVEFGDEFVVVTFLEQP